MLAFALCDMDGSDAYPSACCSANPVLGEITGCPTGQLCCQTETSVFECVDAPTCPTVDLW